MNDTLRFAAHTGSEEGETNFKRLPTLPNAREPYSERVPTNFDQVRSSGVDQAFASLLLTMSWLDMLLKEGERASCLRSDLTAFAEHCLKLRPKTGSAAPLIFNPAQLELHRRIEEQKAKTGRVRVIV